MNTSEKLGVLCAVLFLFLPIPLHGAPPGSPSDWVMTFDDEFVGAALDATKWATTLSPGWQSEEAALSFWASPDTAGTYHSVSDGVLSLICNNVQTDTGQNCNNLNGTPINCPYTCGVISGHDAFNQMYGYFEANMMLPKGGSGMWPAFWMISKSADDSWVWPPEIDIMEAQGSLPTENFMTTHRSSNWPGTGGSDIYSTYTYTGPDFTAAFHTFGVLWTPAAITWYIDGVRVAKDTMEPPIAGNGFPGMYMILNNAVANGSGFGAAPDGSTVFPNALQVHYVRVYAYNTAPPVISAISVSSVTATSSTISWTTDQDSNSQVAYGLTATHGSLTQPTSTFTTSHSQTLTNLTPGTTYHFSVMSTNQAGTLSASPDGTFQTLQGPPGYTITASAGTGGTITPNGAVQVAPGNSQTFTIAANAGYSIGSVLIDGSSVGPVSSYTFRNVTGNHTIMANFVLRTETITASAGRGGTIAPAGSVPVSYGANETFTINANRGYAIANVTVDGISVGAVTSYTFTNVTTNHTISAAFKLQVQQTYTITASAGTGGTISPSGSVVVNAGSSQTFTITPTSGYTLSGVTVDGTSVGAVTSYTFSGVSANHTIGASFAAQTVQTFPYTGILDTFSRGNQGPPPSSSWTTYSTGSGSGLEVVNDACKGAVSGLDNIAYWNTAFGPNTEVYVTMSQPTGSGSAVLLFARFNFVNSAILGQGYFLVIVQGSGISLFKTNGTTATQIGSTLTGSYSTYHAGDSFGLQLVGTTITIWYKPSGGTWTSLASYTDSTYTSAGNIGLDIADTTGGAINFGGGTH